MKTENNHKHYVDGHIYAFKANAIVGKHIAMNTPTVSGYEYECIDSIGTTDDIASLIIYQRGINSGLSVANYSYHVANGLNDFVVDHKRIYSSNNNDILLFSYNKRLNSFCELNSGIYFALIDDNTNTKMDESELSYENFVREYKKALEYPLGLNVYSPCIEVLSDDLSGFKLLTKNSKDSDVYRNEISDKAHETYENLKEQFKKMVEAEHRIAEFDNLFVGKSR